MQKMDENKAIELLINTPLLRYEKEMGTNSELGKAMLLGVTALEKQNKIKERIAKYKEKQKRNPWEEMFIGEVVKLLEEFAVEE